MQHFVGNVGCYMYTFYVITILFRTGESAIINQIMQNASELYFKGLWQIRTSDAV